MTTTCETSEIRRLWWAPCHSLVQLLTRPNRMTGQNRMTRAFLARSSRRDDHPYITRSGFFEDAARLCRNAA